jgi:hypothetical protein
VRCDTQSERRPMDNQYNDLVRAIFRDFTQSFRAGGYYHSAIEAAHNGVVMSLNTFRFQQDFV